MLPVSIPIYEYICRVKRIEMDIGERTKTAIHKLTGLFSYRQKVGLLVIAGVVCGLGGLFMYLLRAHTYFIGDDPSACVNCHIMTPYYATWTLFFSKTFPYFSLANDKNLTHKKIMKKP